MREALAARSDDDFLAEPMPRRPRTAPRARGRSAAAPNPVQRIIGILRRYPLESVIGAAILVVLVTLAFIGLAFATTRVLFLSNAASSTVPRGEPSWWMVVPVVAGLAVLVLLGVYPPDQLVELLQRGASELQGVV